MNYGQNTQDIRSLVKNYTFIPGLVLTTIGGYAVFNGVFSILWDSWLYWVLFGSNQNSWLANLGPLAAVTLPYALCIVVVYAVIRYYKRRFGQVKPRAEETLRLTIELVGAYVAYLIAQTLDVHLHLAVSSALLVFALFLLIHWWMFARGLMHYLLLAAIAVVLSVVPLFNSTVYYWLYIKDPAPDWYSLNITIFAGLLLLIAGLLDHWHMVRMFARVRSYVVANSSDVPESTDMKAEMNEL